MKYLKILFWMAAFFFAIHFSMQNRDEVILRYSFQDYSCFENLKVPLFLVILCSIFLGVLIGGLGDLYRRFQLKRALRQSQKTVERLEKEVQTLRNLGVPPPALTKGDG
jgi:uncharacterized integral membrane protein